MSQDIIKYDVTLNLWNKASINPKYKVKKQKPQ